MSSRFLTCPVEIALACADFLSGFEKGSQRRARFLRLEHEVPGMID